MQPSIFSRIINGEIPCHKVYEDDKTLAFLDLHPITLGHTLVVPKIQVDHLWDLPDEYYVALREAVKKVGFHIREVLGCQRVGVIVEGLEVPHVHVKLVPIYKTGDLQKPQITDIEPDHTALTAMAERLKIGDK
jgi:histidine triad (HIT) family protein